MAQNRKAPAYQEYAADVLSNREFRIATLAERGLIYTLRNECWVNGSVPSDKEKLAKYLGVSIDAIETNLTASVMNQFVVVGEALRCPELDDYRNHLQDIREKQSKGGKKGALTTNAKFGKVTKESAGDSQLTRVLTRDSLVKSSLDEQSQNQSLENDDNSNDIFIEEYDSHDEGGIPFYP